MGFIYQIRNKVTGQSYVGRTINLEERWYWHRKNLKSGDNSPHLQHAYNKYGEENFEYLVVEECPDDQLGERETYWIDTLDTFYNGYNLTRGGEGGRLGMPHSDESRQLMSQNTRGRKKSPEHIAKTIKNLRPGWNKGLSTGPLPEEHRRKIGESNRGQKRSEEQCQRIREGRSGIPCPEDQKRQLSELYKGTILITNENVTIRIRPEDLDKYPGWRRGRHKRKLKVQSRISES